MDNANQKKEDGQKTKKRYFKTILRRKKYSTKSYLLNVLNKYPRRTEYYFLGERKTRKSYTMPFKLSRARFISNRLFQAYYNNLKTKKLRLIASKKKKRYNIYQNISSQSNELQTADSSSSQRNEKTKNFIISLEERLDSTILRLLNFKPTTILKSRKQ